MPIVGEPRWFYRTPEDWESLVLRLKQIPCPHCQRVGTLNQHGFLYGFPRKTVRARRLFCNNRHHRPGCGRTVSVWLSNKLRRLGITTHTLLKFLRHAALHGVTAACRALGGPWSERTWQRHWRRFLLAQSQIRTALSAFARPPPEFATSGPLLRQLAQQVLAHVQAAFGHANCPLAAYQQAARTFFL